MKKCNNNSNGFGNMTKWFHIAKKYCKQNNNRTFVEIDGADHGFTSPGDDDLTHTDTTFFRNMVYDKTLRWINEKHDK